MTRFRPDPQDGGGFFHELVRKSVMGGLKGLKSGRGVRDRIQMAKEGAKWSAKQAVKRKLMKKMAVNRAIVTYPTMRSEIMTFNMQGNLQRYEYNNRVIVGLVLSEAFNGKLARNPFCFQKFGVSKNRQLVRGEEYPYETLELVHNNGTQDLRGYYRFLQATGCLCKHQGNMVRSKDWGQGKNCTLFVFDNAACHV